MMELKKAHILKELEAEILRLQGFKPSTFQTRDIGLGTIAEALPNGSFPTGAVHEFLSKQAEDSAATSAFISGLLSTIMGSSGVTAWISSSRTLFPPALKSFGIEPDHFIFIDLKKEKDVIWAMEEALKCSALASVVGEVRDIDFTTSRRLQLAVEHSRVTGFVHRNSYRSLNTTACVSRWQITPLPSEVDELPGIGFPKWRVELLRIRNGRSGAWDVQWVDGRFATVTRSIAIQEVQHRKAG